MCVCVHEKEREREREKERERIIRWPGLKKIIGYDIVKNTPYLCRKHLVPLTKV